MFTHELKCYISNKTQRTINIQGDIKMISLNLPTFYYVLHYCALPSKLIMKLHGQKLQGQKNQH